jgi:hypothetical protein
MVYLTAHLAFSMLVGQYGTSFNSQRQTPTDTAAVLYSLGRSLRDEFRSPISIQLDTVCIASIITCADSNKTWKPGASSNGTFLDTLLVGLGPIAHSAGRGRPVCDDLHTGPFLIYVLRPVFDTSGASIEIAKTCIRTLGAGPARGFGEGEEFHFRYGPNGWVFVARIMTWIT